MILKYPEVENIYYYFDPDIVVVFVIFYVMDPKWCSIMS
jgi:hypothetical protein